MTSIKEALKRILPPPVHAFNREIARVLAAVESSRAETSALRRELEQERKKSQEQQQVLQQQVQQQQRILEALEPLSSVPAMLEDLSKISTSLDQAQRERRSLTESVERARRQAMEASRYASEAVWAQIFNNTITDSAWLKDKAFSPGRWAVGYPYLYVMYRVLNEARPKRILELGLGQSTRMIAQYAAAFDDVEHIVVEHDPEWIQFFCNSFPLPQNTKIVQLEREMVSYKEAESVRVFKGFKEAFQGQKFDFISVDAPLGSDMKQYSRIDILYLVPECLTENFIIMIDDTERIGEKHTLLELENLLSGNDFSYQKGRYLGSKECTIFCGHNLKFLASL